MIIERFVNGRARSNAYLLGTEPGGGCLVVDPGVGAADRLRRRIDHHRFEPQAVLLTHGHPDHTWNARLLSADLGVDVHLHRSDHPWLDDPATGGHVPVVSWAGRLIGRLARLKPARLVDVSDGTRVPLDGMAIEVRHTPGHTAGSSCFIAGDTCFTGDTVFARGPGHTVYPGGDRSSLEDSIRSVVLDLPDGTRLLPGHGGETTIDRARRHLQGLRLS